MENCKNQRKTKLEELQEERELLIKQIDTVKKANQHLQSKIWSLEEQIKGIEEENRQGIEENDKPETQIAELKELLEHRMNKIKELNFQHQSDCIRISELTVTIDTLVDRYAGLRKIHGVN